MHRLWNYFICSHQVSIISFLLHLEWSWLVMVNSRPKGQVGVRGLQARTYQSLSSPENSDSQSGVQGPRESLKATTYSMRHGNCGVDRLQYSILYILLDTVIIICTFWHKGKINNFFWKCVKFYYGLNFGTVWIRK